MEAEDIALHLLKVDIGDMDKKQLSERDICTKFITPALEKAGWNVQTQIREELRWLPKTRQGRKL